MKAILSDVHGNLEAFQAVLEDIRRKEIYEVYNLGDTVGYGPNPLECLDLTMNLKVTLQGHFEAALFQGIDGFGTGAVQTIYWTRMQLSLRPEYSISKQRLALLKSLVPRFREFDIEYVHGTVRNPLCEYLFPEDIYNSRKMAKIGDLSGPLTFAGHTHVPGLFRERTHGDWEYFAADEREDGFAAGKGKVICNVGSVGQPRDQDPRACYVTFDGERIRFHRVGYPFDRTIRKIHENPDLPGFHGDRLAEGR